MVHIRIKKIEKYAEENNIPIMQKDGIEFLTKYIKDNNIKNILEIGSAIGYSSIMMALVDNDIKVTTIERDEERYNIALKNIDEFNLNDRINIILGDALDTNIEGTYDLIFIDAAKSQYIKFFEKYELNLKQGGVIVTDNLSFHGLVEDESKTTNRNTKQLVRKIRKYIDYLKENTNYETQFYQLGDGIAISIKK
jgi:predicted O-methyltransferase YrrM